MSLLNDILKQIEAGAQEMLPIQFRPQHPNSQQSIPQQPIRNQNIARPLPEGWDSETYSNFKRANPRLDVTPEDTVHMLGIDRPQIRTPREIQRAPFKMFEDGSFQGNPSAYQTQHPNFNFYEDNTFAPNRNPNQVNPQDILRKFRI